MKKESSSVVAKSTITVNSPFCIIVNDAPLFGAITVIFFLENTPFIELFLAQNVTRIHLIQKYLAKQLALVNFYV